MSLGMLSPDLKTPAPASPASSSPLPARATGHATGRLGVLLRPGSRPKRRRIPARPLGSRPVDRDRLFKLDVPVANALGRRLLECTGPSLERLFRLDQINGIYRRVGGPDAPRGADFMRQVLADLNVSYRISDGDLARIPRAGPLVVVANHPFGAIEGIILSALLGRVRPDVKVMANSLLSRVPEIRDALIYVDPFGSKGSARDNLRPLRESIRWIEGGGALGVFPAGEVAHLDLRRREVTDPAWSSTIARIVRKAGAPVLPLYFAGHNGPLFHLLGLIHPRLRTALLPRELMNKRGTEIEIRVGSLLSARKLSACESDEELTEFVRQRTFVLQHRNPAGAPAAEPPAALSPAPPPAARLRPGLSGGIARGVARVFTRGLTRLVKSPKEMEPIVAAGPADRLAAEVAALPADQRLVDADDYAVFHARAEQAPAILRELGRLREITYRATGEGTGKSIDLDRFDQWYEHLFVWHRPTSQVIGAYRLGPSDQIIDRHGKRGLYTSTLFDFKGSVFDRLGPALELGRSFVRREWQRGYAPLMLLWKGIGRFVVAHPAYKYLFGPVSISNDYQSVSRQLMVQFLLARHTLPEFVPLTRALNPFRVSAVHGCGPESVRRVLKESDDVSDLVAEIEPDGKGIPVLLRQYLKLGARFFSFNVDRDFNDAVDALMLVDLTRTDPRTLERYMGREGLAGFLGHHGLSAPQRPRKGPPPHPADA